MPLDFTNAPPGIKEYADGVQNLSNEQLFERIAGWPERETARPSFSSDGSAQQWRETLVWALRVEIEELRDRLGTWFAVNRVVLPPYSGATPTCPKCGANGKGDFKTHHHAEPESEAICDGRLEPGREHLHRMCKPCGYEWLEECLS